MKCSGRVPDRQDFATSAATSGRKPDIRADARAYTSGASVLTAWLQNASDRRVSRTASVVDACFPRGFVSGGHSWFEVGEKIQKKEESSHDGP